MLLLIVAVPSLCALAAWTVYLAFCAYVIRQTGGTEGLRDVARAVIAFRGRRGLLLGSPPLRAKP
jgi:hypothetical protein